MTPTDLAVSIVRGATSVFATNLSEQALIGLVVFGVNQQCGGGDIDSHRVADAFFSRRMTNGQAPERQQTLDYVQHMFREAKNVCRHADGRFYHAHLQVECSATCADRYAKSQGVQRRAISECCFVEVTTQGKCPFGCDE